MAMDTEEKTKCTGGWAFILLSVGLFVFIPGTIILGIYADDDGWTTMKIVGIVLFVSASVLLIIGIILCIYWCLNYKLGGEGKDPEAAEASTKNGGANGPARSSKQKAETSNGAAAQSAAAKYQSQPENSEDEEEESSLHGDGIVEPMPKQSTVPNLPPIK